MAKKDLTPTPLLLMKERSPVSLIPPRPETRFRVCTLLWLMLVLVARQSFAWLCGRLTPQKQAETVRELLERMGFLWVKIGQMMAIRNDAYPDEFCRELSKLRFRADGFPFELAKRVLETELGGPLENYFKEFDAVPFRAGTISQIHRATLPDGSWVAVKVQRPDAELTFVRDMALITWVVRLCKRFGIQQHLRWDDVLWELNQIMTAEIDYRYEASNIRRMRKTLARHKICVPRVHDKLSTQRVLVMEFIRGALMSDVVHLTATDPGRLQRWLIVNNINLRNVGRRLFVSYLRQLMEDNLLHGNLHPGNIILLRDNRFAFVDLSILTTIESEFLRKYIQSMRALATYEYGKAAEFMLLLCPDLPVVDLPDLKERLIRCFRAWDARSELKRMPYNEKSLANVYRELSKILYANRIVPTLTFMKICNTWSTLDASLSYLIPDANYSRMFRKYFTSAYRRAFRDSWRGASIMSAILGLRETISEYQQILGPVLRRGALVFQGGTTKLSDALANIVHLVRMGVFGTLLFFVLKFVNLFASDWFARLPLAEHIESLVDRVAVQDFDLLIVIIVALAYAFRVLGRLENRFKQQDVRLPRSSQTN